VRTDQSDALYSIADISTMWLKAFVPETDIPHVRIGQELDVRVTAMPDRVFKARITYVGAVFEATTRRMMVRSEVVNAGALLKAEMFASFRIATGEGDTTPAVPSEAVIREGDVAAVFVEAEPMTFRRREVRLGVEREGRVQIRQGLAAGELVVARGAIFLDNQWHQ
jgi:cobalt-zinc-cadmium efflux system membrane fusion protein